MTAAGARFLPPALRCFLSLYESGSYFEAHEVLEKAWLRNRSEFYRGLIILAAAFCKRDRGNPRGTARNLRKARGYLAPFTGAHLGFWVPDLIREIDLRLEALRLPGNRPPHLPLRPNERYVLGREPEWEGEERG